MKDSRLLQPNLAKQKWTNLWKLMISVAGLPFLFSCGPQLQLPNTPSTLVERERKQQLEMVFKRAAEYHDRLFRIYSRIRTQAADLCGTDVAPYWGFFLKDSPPNQIRIAAITDRSRDAGLQEGDVIRKVAGYVVEPHFLIQATPGAERVKKILDKAGFQPVEIEVRRGGKNITATLAPELGCRYGITILYNETSNAFTDGSHIFINTGMMRLADTDDEIAVALSHELAHIVLRHVDRRSVNTALGELIGTAIDLGIYAAARVDTGGLARRVGGQTGRLVFSKEFEMEADYLALYLIARAGFDISKAPDLFRKMAMEHPQSINAGYSYTHPSTPERAAALTVTVDELSRKLQTGEVLTPPRIGNPKISSQVIVETTLPVPHQPDAIKLVTDRISPDKGPPERPATVQKTATAIKLFATVHHLVRRSNAFVESGMTLKAEYTDLGEGHGPSRLIYPNNSALDGEFWIAAANEDFKDNVAGTLMNPDSMTGYSRDDVKGFASYSGFGGTTIECAYVIQPNGHGRGTCIDNKGGQYRLVF